MRVVTEGTMTELWETIEPVVTTPAVVAILVLLASSIAGAIVVRVLRVVVHRATRSTAITWDDELAAKLGTPLVLLMIATPWIPLEPRVVKLLHGVSTVVTIVAVVWVVFRSIDLVRSQLGRRAWAIDRPASLSLLALGARFAKVAVLAISLIIALSQLGVSVASLIAGLGIGGLVIALAAQKTVENVFGAVSIGIDQPMREGDFVRVYDFVGTVEQIGLRSTRIRTLDRTLITIPNGELSNQRIESFTARDRIRLACTIGLVYTTTADQMRAVLAALEGILRRHPQIWTETVVVRFKDLAQSSLDLEIMAWFQTSDWNEFQLIRQEVLIDFMEAIESCGTSIAFPTRTLHVNLDQPRATPAP
jgi:MscS family membrane protein